MHLADESIHSDKERLLLYGVYTKLLEGIMHYESVQATYRSMASWLLLASVAVVGFIFSVKISLQVGPHLILAAMVSGVALIVITAFGVVDLVFQERMMVANFIEAVKLEKQYVWLPQVHNRMVVRGTPHGSPIRKSVFYIGCASCLIILLGVAIALLVDPKGWVRLFAVGAFVVVGIALYAWVFSLITGRYQRLMQKALKKSGGSGA